MFILSHIKLSTTQIDFFPHERKLLKFQVNKSTKKYPFPSKFINSHEIEWNIHQAFPEGLYEKQIFFEIYSPHEFGFHEQQLQSVLQGQIKIQKTLTFNNFEVYRACGEKLVGYLSCNVRHRGQIAEPIEIRSGRDQILMIKSIAVHIPSANNKKICCKLKVATQQCKTIFVRSFSGEIMFTDKMVFHKNELNHQGILSVFQLNSGSQAKIGQGTISLQGERPSKKVTILDMEEQLLGEAYIDCLQQFKDQDARTNSSSLPNYLHKSPPTRENMISRDSMSRLLSSFRKSSPFPQNIIVTPPSRNINNPQFIGTKSSITKSKLSMGQIRQNRHLNKSYRSSLFEIEQQRSTKNNLPMIWGRY